MPVESQRGLRERAVQRGQRLREWRVREGEGHGREVSIGFSVIKLFRNLSLIIICKGRGLPFAAF
jgi:hypothetical protein